MSFITSLIIGCVIGVAGAIVSNTGKGNNKKDPHDRGGVQDEHLWFDSGETCNGDCDNCPPHYGYRYGRWYYGHGHQHGCQRNGNGGASGRTFRD